MTTTPTCCISNGSTQNTFPHFSTENEASRQLSQTPRHGSMSYDKCVVLIQTIPGCKNFGMEETRCRRGKAKWRVLGKELGAWLQFPAFAITCVLSTRLW